MESKSSDKGSQKGGSTTAAGAADTTSTAPQSHTTAPHTAERREKIKELQSLLHQHFDPLPPQLLFMKRMLSDNNNNSSDGEHKQDEEQSAEWFYCTCFLASREWDVQRAFAMMQDVVAYREKHQLDAHSQLPPAISVRGWDSAHVLTALNKPPRESPGRAERIAAGVLQNLSSGIHYWDKGGRPVVYVQIDSLDEPGLIKKLKESARIGQKPADVLWEYSQHFIGVAEDLVLYQLLQQRQQQQQQDEPQDADAKKQPTGYAQGVVTVVMDMKGLHLGLLWKPMLDLFRDVTSELFKYYPDMVHRIIAVNAPGIVRIAFNMVKSVMPVDFQKKISFVSAHDSLKALQEEIELENIPVFLGGKCKCQEQQGNGTDGFCINGYDRNDPLRRNQKKKEEQKKGKDEKKSNASVPGGDSSNPEAEAATDDVSLSAGRRATRVVELPAGQTAAWEFAVSHDGADVTFTVFFVPASASDAAGVAAVLSKKELASADVKKLQPYVVNDMDASKTSDAFTAPEKGTLVLLWQNTRSWLATRTVQLRVYTDHTG